MHLSCSRNTWNRTPSENGRSHTIVSCVFIHFALRSPSIDALMRAQRSTPAPLFHAPRIWSDSHDNLHHCCSAAEMQRKKSTAKILQRYSTGRSPAYPRARVGISRMAYHRMPDRTLPKEKKDHHFKTPEFMVATSNRFLCAHATSHQGFTGRSLMYNRTVRDRVWAHGAQSRRPRDARFAVVSGGRLEAQEDAIQQDREEHEASFGVVNE